MPHPLRSVLMGIGLLPTILLADAASAAEYRFKALLSDIVFGDAYYQDEATGEYVFLENYSPSRRFSFEPWHFGAGSYRGPPLSGYLSWSGDDADRPICTIGGRSCAINYGADLQITNYRPERYAISSLNVEYVLTLDFRNRRMTYIDSDSHYLTDRGIRYDYINGINSSYKLIAVNAVPLPATLPALAGALGLVGLAGRSRRRRRE